MKTEGRCMFGMQLDGTVAMDFSKRSSCTEKQEPQGQNQPPCGLRTVHSLNVQKHVRRKNAKVPLKSKPSRLKL